MQELTTPPYKAGNGVWLTATLFYERWLLIPEEDRGYKPLFSFKGVKGYLDARKTFVEVGDPTGYRWAQQYLGSWVHFQALCQTSWFPQELESWRQELNAKMKSDAFARIKEIAGSDAPQAFLASKYIEKAEHEKAASGRGRPSKEELKGELKRAADIMNRENEDAQRMGLDLGKPN